MRWVGFIFALGAAAMWLGGCEASRGPDDAEYEALPAGVHYQVMPMEGLARYLAFPPAPSIEPAGEKPMSVAVPVRLRTGGQMTVQYKFQFYDGAGRPIESDPPWSTMQIPAGMAVYLQGTARDVRSHDWRLLIRPSK